MLCTVETGVADIHGQFRGYLLLSDLVVKTRMMNKCPGGNDNILQMSYNMGNCPCFMTFLVFTVNSLVNGMTKVRFVTLEFAVRRQYKLLGTLHSKTAGDHGNGQSK